MKRIAKEMDAYDTIRQSILRYDDECGEVMSHQVTEKELKEILNKIYM